MAYIFVAIQSELDFYIFFCHGDILSIMWAYVFGISFTKFFIGMHSGCSK